MRRYLNTVVPTQLASGVNDTAVTLEVPSTAGFPNPPFLLGLERGTPNEEVVLCTAKGATTFTVIRGYDGTTAKAHDIATTVEHTVAAIDYREAGIVRISTATRDSLAGNELWVGRTIFNTDTNKLQVRIGSAWVNVGPAVGTIAAYGGATPPVGALLCNGAEVSRTTYADLFSVVGTAYGAGDGATTFNLPDLRQRFPLGKADSGTGNTLGATGGAINHTHIAPSHTHTNPNTSSAGSHSHSVGNTGSGGSHNHSVGNTSSTGSHTHTTSSSNIAGQGGRNFEGGPSGHDHDVHSSGTHSHTNPNTSTTGSHTHSVPNTSSTGSHSHTQGNTGSSGGTATSAANPPFQVVNYIIYV